MTDTYTDLDDQGWLNLFEGISQSWFRLETLQVYAVDYEDEGQADFHQTGQVDETPNPWRQMIRRHTDAGRRLQRVHIFEEPLTEYLRYELAIYALNSAAGEDTRLIPTPAGRWPDDLPKATDFWLFDDRDVWDMDYDAEGRFLVATRSRSHEHLERCRRWRDTALSSAVSLGTYALAHR